MSVQKIGYSYLFSLNQCTWNGEKEDLLLCVDVLFNNHETIDTPAQLRHVTQHLRVFMDIANERVALDVIDNPYFDEARIVDCCIYRESHCIAPIYSGLDVSNRIAQAYCQQVKSGDIPPKLVDARVTQTGYWFDYTY